MNAYRLRDIQTNAIQVWQAADNFDPLYYTPPDGFLLEHDRGEGFAVYTKPSPIELIEQARADVAEVRHWADSVDARLDALEAVL